MIFSVTDKFFPRRTGKVRAGLREGTRLTNTDHFLLHDAPQLIEKLGEKPTEIFFTVYSDNVHETARADLRRYTSSELVCLSQHGRRIEGINTNQVAAFFGTGDAPNVTATPFPGSQRSRTRICDYKTCPDYVAGSCSEHLFLDMVIPQFSMGAIFTLDSTSINAILNIHGCFNMTAMRFHRRVAGEIFRLYKKPGEINYEAANGKKGKRSAPIVHIEHVPFEVYEARFRDQIHPADWSSLMGLRNRMSLMTYDTFFPNSTAAELAAPDEVEFLQAPTAGALQAPQITQIPQAPTTQEDDDTKYLKLANDPVLLPLFEEIAGLMGKENTESNRVATVRKTGSIQRTVDYLKARIGEIKRAKKATTTQKASEEDRTAAIDTSAKTVESSQPQKATSPLY